MDAVVIILLLSMLVYQTRNQAFWRRKPGGFNKLDVRDAANQLRFVMAAPFHKKRLMNKQEYEVFRVVETLIRTGNRGHRVFAQTSLGEFIGSNDPQAAASVNSKRVDILIIDRFGHPAAAIEYQGAGHYQGNAAARDAVKREALRKAGVPYVEIAQNDGAEEVKRKVLQVLH